jgi:hypothetical protein
MKEISEIIASLICAQPVPTALSVISCDSKRAKLERCDFCVSINNFFYFLHFCGTLRKQTK